MCSAIQPLIDHHGTYTAPITTCVSGIACMPGNKRAHVPPLAEAQQTVPFSASKLLLSAQLGVLLSRDLTPSGDLPFLSYRHILFTCSGLHSTPQYSIHKAPYKHIHKRVSLVFKSLPARYVSAGLERLRRATLCLPS